MSDALTGFSQKLAPAWEGTRILLSVNKINGRMFRKYTQEPITYAHIGNMKRYNPRSIEPIQLNAEKIQKKLDEFKSSVVSLSERGEKRNKIQSEKRYKSRNDLIKIIFRFLRITFG